MKELYSESKKMALWALFKIDVYRIDYEYFIMRFRVKSC